MEEIDVNIKNDGGTTALFIACSNGDVDIVKVLLIKMEMEGENVYENILENSILDNAMMYGYPEVLMEILKVEGINNIINEEDKYFGSTFLSTCCHAGYVEVVRELLKIPGIDVNYKDRRGYSPLMKAARDGHIEVVRELLKMTALNTFDKNNKGRTARVIAFKNNHTDIAMLL